MMMLGEEDSSLQADFWPKSVGLICLLVQFHVHRMNLVEQLAVKIVP